MNLLLNMLLLFVHHNVCRHAYTYGRLLNEALHDFKTRWNSHKIRPSRTAGCPSGVPDDLYSLPELTGSSDAVVSNPNLFTYNSFLLHTLLQEPPDTPIHSIQMCGLTVSNPLHVNQMLCIQLNFSKLQLQF